MVLILSRYEIGSSESKFSRIERFEMEGERARERDSRNSKLPSILILQLNNYLEERIKIYTTRGQIRGGIGGECRLLFVVCREV